MDSAAMLDCAGRRRSPATVPGYHRGRSPRNKGLRYPPDPPTVEEIIGVMRAAGEDRDGIRLRALIVVLWRAGLRISEALALAESDLDPSRGAVLVRRGKGGKRREVGMDRWAWDHLSPWLELRPSMPPGALFCVLRGPTAGGPARAQRSESNFETPPSERASGDDSPRISYATHTPSRCHAKVCRCWSSSASSGTPTCRSPLSTCAGSTTPKSSTPSTNDPHP
jgi:integrase